MSSVENVDDRTRAGDRHNLRARTARLGLAFPVGVEEPRQSEESHDIRSQRLGDSVVASRACVLVRSRGPLVVFHGLLIARAA